MKRALYALAFPLLCVARNEPYAALAWASYNSPCILDKAFEGEL